MSFLTYALSQVGQDRVPGNGYAPLSEKMQKDGLAQAEKIRPT